MLNIVILEDQADQAERLTRMLEKYASSHLDFAYTLKRYERSIPMLTEYKCDADILFDVVSWNLYLGWYVPGLWLNDVWMRFFHLVYPSRCLGYSEYGCEGMPNLHSAHPHRGDHTEEYQAIYHEYLLKCFERNPYMWATHVWNMFDFAADARDQGGEPGMNHKGLK